MTIFFATHDPTTLNRQGNDIGTQYRSIILYTTPVQKEEAESFIREIEESTKEGNHVVTEIRRITTKLEPKKNKGIAKDLGEIYSKSPNLLAVWVDG